MATAPPDPVQWIPEDDLLLRNAVQAGASLEALAKGAVQFSRRFTLEELRNRWHSLLYDPDIAAQSSSRMFELEISGINFSLKLSRSDSSPKNKEGLQKRKSESIRKKYYAMRKKIRNEFFSTSDLGFFEPNPHEINGQGAELQKQIVDGNPLDQNCMLGETISENLGLQEEDLDILRHAFPETIRDITAASGTPNVSQAGCSNSFEDNRPKVILGSYGFDENVSSSLAHDRNNSLEAENRNRKSRHNLQDTSISENPHNSSVGYEDRQQFGTPHADGFASFQTMMLASDQRHLQHWTSVQDVSGVMEPVGMRIRDAAEVSDNLIPVLEGKENNSSVYTGEFADPDSLLNLSNDDEILLMDVDEKHADDKSTTDNLNTAIRDSCKEVQGNDIVKLELEPLTVSETDPLPVPSAKPVMLAVASFPVHGDQKIDLHPEVSPSNSTSNSDIGELRDGKICCTLNTEYPDIPCNDDIFLLIHPSTSFGSCATQPNTTLSVDASALVSEKDNELVSNFPLFEKDSTKTFPWQEVGVPGLPESHPVHPVAGDAAKTKTHDSRTHALLSGFDSKLGNLSKGRSLYAIPKVAASRLVDKDVAGLAKMGGESSATVHETMRSVEAGSGATVYPESFIDSSISDHEDSENDNDVPYFSDVEAMILEMDLDPFDQDFQANRQVPNYQYDETKRTIIRLEQAARSCLQRTMTSHEALAILYGRHLRHYIKKPEVLLGRSTDDVDIDIDLRKEGRANKISRRQAIIKMENDGSFFLKNLGKSSVYVNGMTIATGHSMTLRSSCLIEIRGMSFVFEINQRYVMKHLGNFFQENKGKDLQV